KAQERMLFGWGGWGRNRIFDYNSQGELVDMSVTDSQWIITFGINGVFGLASLTTSLLLPVFLFAVKRYPAKTWFHPKVAPSAVLGVCLTLFVFDSLLNVTFNPTFPLICGGLSGLVAKPAESLTGQAKSAATLSTPKAVSPPSGKRPLFPQRRFP
ncbi:MAG: O-antigen ligase domain-containing protein, partial [Microcystaceae cyanobacterium]